MKKLIISALLVSAGLISAQQKQMPSMRDSSDKAAQAEKMHAAHLAKMQQTLDLNASQVEQIRAMHEKSKAQRMAARTKMQEVHKERMAQNQAAMLKRQEEMKAILSKEQFAKWEQMNAERKAQHKDSLQSKRNRKTMDGQGGYHKRTVLKKQDIAK